MKIKHLLPLAGLLLAGCATHPHTATTPPPGPSVAGIQAMVQAHISDAVIINQIQNSRTRYHLTADEIIGLKNAGASDAVILALINTAAKPPVQTTAGQPDHVYPPYVYLPPPPFFWWGWGPGFHGGGYHRWC